MMKKTLWMAFVLSFTLGLVSCAPAIYLKDRHTIMEEEAAGEWPEFERDLLDKSKEQGPTAFQKTDINAHKRRLYNVLNGELTSQNK